jgi:crossover junction endodeoxyribonuclease RusA
MRAFLPKGGKFPIVTHQKSPALKAWREVVALAVPKGTILDGPVCVTLEFYMPIPKSRPRILHTEKQRLEWTWPAKQPDLDKMIRAILDALTGVVFHDDSQVVHLVSRKQYGNEPGVEVWVTQYAPTEKDGT